MYIVIFLIFNLFMSSNKKIKLYEFSIVIHLILLNCSYTIMFFQKYLYNKMNCILIKLKWAFKTERLTQ